MRRLTIVLFAAVVGAAGPVAAAEEDEHFFGCMLEYWNRGDAEGVIREAPRFLEKFPDGAYTDKLYTLLGDAHWLRASYRGALAAYGQVKGQEEISNLYDRRLDCLFSLGRYNLLLNALSGTLPEGGAGNDRKLQLRFFYAAESCLNLAAEARSEQERSAFWSEALKYYNGLLAGNNRVTAMLGVAEVHCQRGAYPKAVMIYEQLLRTNPEMEGELLFRIGVLQSNYAVSKALDSFGRVAALRGAKSSESALWRAKLLYTLRRYDDLLDEEPLLAASGNKSEIAFLAGCSAFALKRDEQAQEKLKPLLVNDLSDSEKIDVKMLLSTLLISSYRLKDDSGVENWGGRLHALFPSDPFLARIDYLRALAFKRNDRYQEADSCFQNIASSFPGFDRIEEVEHELCSLSYKLRQWQRCIVRTQDWMKRYPSGRFHGKIASLLVGAMFQINKDPALDPVASRYYAASIRQTIAENQCLQGEEKVNYLLKNSKLFFENGDYEQAVEISKEIIDECKGGASPYRAHQLVAFVEPKGGKPLEKFIANGEQALVMKENMEGQERWRLSHFNVYDQIAPETGYDKRLILADKGADRLDAVYHRSSRSVSKDRKLWLAMYDYSKIKEQLCSDCGLEPVIDAELHDQILYVLSLYRSALIGSEESCQELAWVQEANLLGWLGEFNDQRLLVEELLKNASTALEPRLLLLVANACHHTGCDDEAAAYYSRIEGRLGNTELAQSAALLAARVQFSLLRPEDRRLDSVATAQILETVKEIQIRKSLSSEPLHLEAGIDYAWMRSSLEEDAAIRSVMFRDLLIAAKESLMADDEANAKGYHLELERDKVKTALYKSYMVLYDACIAAAEAECSSLEGMEKESCRMRKRANELFGDLLEEKKGMTQYLRRRAQEGLASR